MLWLSVDYYGLVTCRLVRLTGLVRRGVLRGLRCGLRRGLQLSVRATPHAAPHQTVWRAAWPGGREPSLTQAQTRKRLGLRRTVIGGQTDVNFSKSLPRFTLVYIR